MSEFIYKKAISKDMNLFVKTRLEVLKSADEIPENGNMSELERQSRNYYSGCLEEDRCVVYLAYEGLNFAGCGGICFYQVMPTYHNPTGRNACIMNMYTKPEYRRQGIATRILDLLVDEAKSREIRRILLETTPLCRSLFEQYGFKGMQTAMELL